MIMTMHQGGDVEQQLRDVGLRVTRQRTTVLSAVATHPHADTQSIIDIARRSVPDLSHQAVYDALRALTTAGLLRCIEPAGSVARYETRTGDNHHHLICRSCGRTEELTGSVVEAWAAQMGAAYGFVDVSHAVELTGVCLSCSQEHRSRR